jgi:hypothetical protein
MTWLIVQLSKVLIDSVASKCSADWSPALGELLVNRDSSGSSGGSN